MKDTSSDLPLGKRYVLTTSTPGCSGNVLVDFGSQSGGVEWVIAQKPYCLLLGDALQR